MKKVYVITHTESLHHVQGLGGGWYDTSLTERGREQAKDIVLNLDNTERLQNVPLYCSDLKRTKETAEIFAKYLNSTVIMDSRLREMSFGDAEGKNKQWQSDHFVPPPRDITRLDHRVYNNAESSREVATRINDFMVSIESLKDEKLVLITHGFALTFILLSWIKVPVENMGYASFYGVSGGVSLLYEDDVFTSRGVLYINNQSYKSKII